MSSCVDAADMLLCLLMAKVIVFDKISNFVSLFLWDLIEEMNNLYNKVHGCQKGVYNKKEN